MDSVPELVFYVTWLLGIALGLYVTLRFRRDYPDEWSRRGGRRIIFDARASMSFAWFLWRGSLAVIKERSLRTCVVVLRCVHVVFFFSFISMVWADLAR